MLGQLLTSFSIVLNARAQNEIKAQIKEIKARVDLLKAELTLYKEAAMLYSFNN